MVTTRRSVKRVEKVATAAVNDGQQQQNLWLTAPNNSLNHLNQDKSKPASRRWPSGYARRGPSMKKKTQYGDLPDNSHLQLQNADVQLCDGVDYIQSSEAVIPAEKPLHEKEASNQAGMLQQCSFEQMQETAIPDPKGFDKFHSSGQLDLPVEPLNCDLPAAGNSSTSIAAAVHEVLDPLLDHKTMAASGGTKNAVVTTSRGGNNVASNNLNGVQGEISGSRFLGNGPQKSASFNLTEIAEKMANDGLDEVDSFGSETLVGGYKVKPKYEIPLGLILAKYGDIGVNCSRTDKFRSFCVELLCEIVQKLMDTNIIAITVEDLVEMMAYIEDLEKENLDIGWLKERLNEILEAKQAIQVLKSSSDEKKCHAELKAEVKKRGQQLEDYKRELAVKEVEVQDLKKVILAAEREFVKTKDGFTKAEKVISENKSKLRHFVNLGSLGEGLL